MTGHRSYRPSNGTEGDIFMAAWCEHCSLNANKLDEPCPIVGDVMAFSIDDPDYPNEWCYQDEQPVCTGFCSGDNPPPRCTETIDMFNEWVA